MTGRDALEFLAAGAAAVQVGTLNFVRPRGAAEVLEQMARHLGERGFRSVAEWRAWWDGSGLGLTALPAPAGARPRTAARRSR
jgi:hypothetical protein